jgi:hypothetical protein
VEFKSFCCDVLPVESIELSDLSVPGKYKETSHFSERLKAIPLSFKWTAIDYLTY